MMTPTYTLADWQRDRDDALFQLQTFQDDMTPAEMKTLGHIIQAADMKARKAQCEIDTLEIAYASPAYIQP